MSKILLYKTPNQEIKLEVLIQNEIIWLNQKQLCELFDVKVVVSKMEITTQYGVIEEKI